jgi:hypothetical protein
VRRLISIILLFAILFNICGYYFTFIIIKQGFRKDFITELKYAIHEKSIVIISITDQEMDSGKSSFKWTEDEEFSYQGKMFDVITQQKQGALNIFRCLNDKNEEILLSKYEDLVKRHTDAGLPYKQKSQQLINQILKEAAIEKKIPDLFFAFFNEFISAYSFSLHTFSLLPLEQPPK